MLCRMKKKTRTDNRNEKKNKNCNDDAVDLRGLWCEWEREGDGWSWENDSWRRASGECERGRGEERLGSRDPLLNWMLLFFFFCFTSSFIPSPPMHRATTIKLSCADFVVLGFSPIVSFNKMRQVNFIHQQLLLWGSLRCWRIAGVVW